jgi:ATP-binding cassette subfamily B protein
MKAVLFCALAILVLHAAQGIFSAGQNYISIKIGLLGLARIRNQLFDWMQRLSLAFYQRSNQGDLIYRATWDTYSIQTLFQQGVFKFLNSFITIILMLVVMWQLNGYLTLISACIFPPLLFTMFLFGKAMNKRSLSAHNADSTLSSFIQQNIASLPVVQSYAREERESTAFANQVRVSFFTRIKQHGVEVVYWLAIAILFGLVTSGLAWWGAREISSQRLTIGELVIFLSYLGQLYEPLNSISQVGTTVSDANAGVTRVFEILDAHDQLPEPTNPIPFPQGDKGVSVDFEEVAFGYSPDTPVLKKITLRVQPGEVVGIVGPSGAGKTTLLNLVPRFYDASSGIVRVHGKDVRNFRIKELRQNVAYVFQESFLLPGTINENISYGAENATEEQIHEAAALANAHDFISRLPQGYETIVGEGGARLSVGEKQRINLARAFLKDAPILLLDEPTSSLDAETETLVVDSLKRLMANRTVLMAAHRFSTLRYVQKVLVLEAGQVSDFGTPKELLERDSYFARLSRASLEMAPTFS